MAETPVGASGAVAANALLFPTNKIIKIAKNTDNFPSFLLFNLNRKNMMCF
jgi:capsular polysaccharide biosynthesis protein